MTRARAAMLVACGVLLAAGCSSAPASAPALASTSARSSAPSSATPSQAPAATQHVVAGPMALDVPATWHVRPVLPNPSGNVTFDFLGPHEVPGECQDTDQGGVCHPWPVVHLEPGGIVVAIRENGMPGSQPPAGGEVITVGGHPARRTSGPADEGCRAIGGSASIDIAVPAVAGMQGWIALDACLAGPDTAAADTAFAAIVASASIH